MAVTEGAEEADVVADDWEIVVTRGEKVRNDVGSIAISLSSSDDGVDISWSACARIAWRVCS